MVERTQTLLVVDDEREICDFVKSFFGHRGLRVIQAHSGAEAVGAAREAQPAVILLDVRMKEADDGISHLPQIRQASPASRILMTTAVDDETAMVRARALGAVDYILKPLVLEELEAAVYRQLAEADKS